MFGKLRAAPICMVRITTTPDGEVLRVKVEGRLVGLWVDELRTVLLRHSPLGAVKLDITDVSFVDDRGEQLLIWLYRIGGSFCEGGVFSDFLFSRLGIPTERRKEARPSRAK